MEKGANKSNDNNNWMIVIIIGIFIWLKHLFSAPTNYYSKSDLAKLYSVDIKTLNKWIAVFCNPEELPYDSYKSKRKLPQKMRDYIVDCLGEPTAEMPVLSKIQIITDMDEMRGNEYRGARNTIRKNAKETGISPEVYAMFNVFPPKIARLISQKVA